MNLGTWADVRTLEKVVTPELMRTVVEHAEPGWFNEDSWYYWHYRLSLMRPAQPVPELPRRAQV
jgi:NADPH-dependent ferric siderophore reductase